MKSRVCLNENGLRQYLWDSSVPRARSWEEFWVTLTLWVLHIIPFSAVGRSENGMGLRGQASKNISFLKPFFYFVAIHKFWKLYALFLYNHNKINSWMEKVYPYISAKILGDWGQFFPTCPLAPSAPTSLPFRELSWSSAELPRCRCLFRLHLPPPSKFKNVELACHGIWFLHIGQNMMKFFL